MSILLIRFFKCFFLFLAITTRILNGIHGDKMCEGKSRQMGKGSAHKTGGRRGRFTLVCVKITYLPHV